MELITKIMTLEEPDNSQALKYDLLSCCETGDFTKVVV